MYKLIFENLPQTYKSRISRSKSPDRGIFNKHSEGLISIIKIQPTILED